MVMVEDFKACSCVWEEAKVSEFAMHKLVSRLIEKVTR
jgi:hypothetical protein